MTTRERGWLLPPAALCATIGVLLGRSSVSPLYAWVACGLCLLAILLTRGKPRFAACLALCVAVGTAAGSMAWHPTLPEEKKVSVQGVVTEELRFGAFGHVSTALSHVTLDGQPFNAGAYWSFYTDDAESLAATLHPGEMVVFGASLYHPDGASNPNGYDFREELLRRGITVGLYGCEELDVRETPFFSLPGSLAALRHRLTISLTQTLGEESGGYAAALLLGVRSGIPSEDRAAFANLGIAHILSVSGFHTGILVAMLAFLFRLLRLPQKARLVLYAIALGTYCMLCGMSQPVLRASLLLLLALYGRILNRPRSALHLTCAVWLILLLANPVQVTGISFQMTFGAVLGIALITPAVQGVLNPRNRLARRAWESIAVVIGAQIGILLPELYHYQRLPMLGLIVNWPASMICSALIAVYWVILLILPFPALAGALAGPISAVTGFFLRLIRNIGALPGITLWTHASTWATAVGVLLLGAGLCAMTRLRWKPRLALAAAGVLAICLSLLPQAHEGTEYIQFSVGGADAAVLWDQDQVIVIDTGENDGVLSSFLRFHRLTPDAVILTHLHIDHAGGLQSMMNDGIPIRLCYLPAGAEEQTIHEDIRLLIEKLRDGGTEIRTLARGDTLELPSGSMTVLWPEAERLRRNQDANDYCMVSLLRLYGNTLLQTGDLNGAYEKYAAVPADLLKAAHHGSASSTTSTFLETVAPQATLLSCRRGNRTEDFRARTGGIPVWSTAESGALTVRFMDGRTEIIPYRPAPEGVSGGE